jgi:hypothetical protein
MAKRDLHFNLYSAMSGVSFVGVLTVPQLREYFEFQWMYTPSLSLFVVSTVIFGVFVLSHIMTLEAEIKVEDVKKSLETSDEKKIEAVKILLDESQRKHELYLKKLGSKGAERITVVALSVFVVALLSLVFALSLQAFLLAMLTGIIIGYCLVKFEISKDDEFMS